MTFIKASLLGKELDAQNNIIHNGCTVTKDGTNKTISIHIFGELEDSTTLERKQFDFLIEGDVLEGIRNDLNAGIATLFKSKAKLNYDDWIKDLAEQQKTTTEINKSDILTNFGITEITTL